MKRQQGSGVVRVYLASPEEVGPMRSAFRDVLEEANEAKAKVHGITFKPADASTSVLGRLFTRTAPDKELLGADLIVATLGGQRGAPDGDAFSRFEAAYERARGHDKDVWLYVPTLDDALLAEPDAALRRVLDFRDRVEREGHARYHAYTDEADWQRQLLDHLVRWLNGLPPAPSPGAVAAGDLDARLALLDAAPGLLTPGARRRVEDAWQFAAAGRLTRAEERFAGALHEQPEPGMQVEYARFLGEAGALEKAEALYDHVLTAGASPVLESLVAAAFGRLGSAHEKQGTLDEARRLFRRSIHLHERLDDQQGLAADYGSLGNVCWMQGALEKAEHAYREALRLNERLGNHAGVATDYGNLGNVYGVWGRLEQAEQMYRTSLELNRRLDRKESMANQYGNLGIVYRVQGRLDEAEAAYREALALHERLDRKEGMAEDYNNLGNVYQERGALDDAEQMYRRALAIDEALGRREGMANQYGNLGVLFQTRGDFDRAEQMYRKSLALFEALGDFMPIEQVKAWISDLEAQRRR